MNLEPILNALPTGERLTDIEALARIRRALGPRADPTIIRGAIQTLAIFGQVELTVDRTRAGGQFVYKPPAQPRPIGPRPRPTPKFTPLTTTPGVQ